MKFNFLILFFNFEKKEEIRNNVCILLKLIFCSLKIFEFNRLHHDQQAAHALESAAAYSSYPTMAGKFEIHLPGSFVSLFRSLYAGLSLLFFFVF